MSTAEQIGSLGPTTGVAPVVDSPRLEVLEGGPPEPVRHYSIVIRRQPGAVVVSVHGELDPSRAAQLGSILVDLVDGQGNLSLVVDLGDASSTEPDSLTVLVDVAERARRRGGTMQLCPSEGIELRGLDHFVG